jgi:peptidoglycan-associated lipoprotein
MMTQLLLHKYIRHFAIIASAVSLVSACSSREISNTEYRSTKPASPEQQVTFNSGQLQKRSTATELIVSAKATSGTPTTQLALNSTHLTADNNRSYSKKPAENVTGLPEIMSVSEHDRVSKELPIAETLKTADGLPKRSITRAAEHHAKEGDTMLEIQPPLPRVLFYSLDQRKLNTEQQATIDHHANFLAVHPDYIIQIHGHTDNQGNKTYNEKLARDRAQIVADQLLAAGVNARQIEVFSWGSEDPLLSVSQYDKNRRVELIYLSSQLAFTNKTDNEPEKEPVLMD